MSGIMFLSPKGDIKPPCFPGITCMTIRQVCFFFRAVAGRRLFIEAVDVTESWRLCKVLVAQQEDPFVFQGSVKSF